MQTTRDGLPASGESQPAVLPDDFKAARAVIRSAISGVEAEHRRDTLLAVLMTKTMPRLIEAYGPQAAAIILSRLGADIASGTAPNCARQ
jgi:hypothetical protein